MDPRAVDPIEAARVRNEVRERLFGLPPAGVRWHVVMAGDVLCAMHPRPSGEAQRNPR